MASTNSAFPRLYGPWAVVTGASAGIGAQFSRSLAARGLNIILIARRVDRLQALAAELSTKHSVETHVIRADLTEAGAATRIGAEVAQFDVGLLVNNAGVEQAGAYLNVPVKDIDRLIALNVTAVAMLARVIGLGIAKRKRGGIIFVSSLSARPGPYGALYSASKAFVSTLSVSLRYELMEHGVEVLTFEPGVVDSEMSARVASQIDTAVLGLEMMPAKEAVESCLTALGKADVHTPGWKNNVFKFFVDNLPAWLTLPYFAKIMRKALPPEQVSLSL